jgi:hypothetical protein
MWNEEYHIIVSMTQLRSCYSDIKCKNEPTNTESDIRQYGRVRSHMSTESIHDHAPTKIEFVWVASHVNLLLEDIF